MTFRETIVHGNIANEHLAQLFDGTDSLVSTVAEFLREAHTEGDILLVVSTAAHWEAIGARLTAAGLDVLEAQRSGRITWKDAADTLRLFMRRGRPDAVLFDRSVGALVRQLNRRGKLTIYGEMVDLLAAHGEHASTQALEDLWNVLGQREAFTLFCGYSASSFGDPRTADVLRGICRAHTHLRSNPRDVLGSYLLHAHGTGEGAVTS